jgi:hypothetical protein
VTVPEWTNPDSLIAVAGVAASADFNAVLENLRFLADPPTCTVRLLEDQEIASGTDSTIMWDQAAWDTTGGDMWDDSSEGVIVIPRDGVYLVYVQVLWEGTTEDNSTRAVYIERDGEFRLAGSSILSPATPEQQAILITSLDEGMYLEAVVRHLSPEAIDLRAMRTRMTVTWLRLPPDEFVEGDEP